MVNIIVGSDTGADSILSFAPMATAPAMKWMTLLSQTLASGGSIRSQSYSFLVTRNSIDALKNEFLEQIEIVNSFYDLPIRICENIDEINIEYLNYVHSEYERYGDRLKLEEFSYSEAQFSEFEKINGLVHSLETAHSNEIFINSGQLERLSGFFSMTWHPDLTALLDEEDLSHFTMDLKFGTIYMGYHTLGKNLSQCFQNGDLDCVIARRVVPQKMINTEIMAYFGPDQRNGFERFTTWFNNNNLERYGYRLDDPTNALGYIPVGKLIDLPNLPERPNYLSYLSTFDFISGAEILNDVNNSLDHF